MIQKHAKEAWTSRIVGFEKVVVELCDESVGVVRLETNKSVGDEIRQKTGCALRGHDLQWRRGLSLLTPRVVTKMKRRGEYMA